MPALSSLASDTVIDTDIFQSSKQPIRFLRFRIFGEVKPQPGT